MDAFVDVLNQISGVIASIIAVAGALAVVAKKTSQLRDGLQSFLLTNWPDLISQVDRIERAFAAMDIPALSSRMDKMEKALGDHLAKGPEAHTQGIIIRPTP